MKLQPCPFCGRDNPKIKKVNFHSYFRVACERCECRGRRSMEKNKAIELWNRAVRK